MALGVDCQLNDWVMSVLILFDVDLSLFSFALFLFFDKIHLCAFLNSISAVLLLSSV